MIYRSPFFVPGARFVGAAWIIGGILMIAITSSRALSGWGSHLWPHVPGKIVHSQIYPATDSSGKSAYYKIDVIYAYSPPSRDAFPTDFQNNKFSFRGFIDSAEDWYALQESQRLTRRYPVGKNVQVYYNPNNPVQAVLRPGEDFGTFSGSLIGLGAVLLGIVLLLFAHTLAAKVEVVARRFLAFGSPRIEG